MSEKTTRREFFRGFARLFLAGGAIAGAGALSTRKGETCTNQGICSGCPGYEGCGLPQALSRKEALKEAERGR